MTTTRDDIIRDAIERSRRHGEIVTLPARTRDEANALRETLTAGARVGESTDYVDTGSVVEVWGYDAESDDDTTGWRVHIQYAA